jgi:hypothetical protein
MKHSGAIPLIILVVLLSAVSASAQRNVSLAENAALRYWSAFSEVQDAAITDQQARELNGILDGTAPYDDLKYKDLLEKNRLALEIMARATSLSNCDWGLDYGLGEEVPVDYARKALVLGRLNVLDAFHLFVAGNIRTGSCLLCSTEFGRAQEARAHQLLSLCALFKLSRKVSNLNDSIWLRNRR